MGTNGVGKEEVTTALGRGRMSGHVRGARPRMGPADGVHERGQWRVGHERGQWRAGHMSGANGGWRTNVFQLKCGVKVIWLGFYSLFSTVPTFLFTIKIGLS
uniref:Uncharacterized protein n=1 Tax=Globodera rostochiensis TaxID=31243 RepID=A0A914HNE9_GLORO